jgi:hypothetical protein
MKKKNTKSAKILRQMDAEKHTCAAAEAVHPEMMIEI